MTKSESGQARGRLQHEAQGVAVRPALAERGHAIDMAGDQMAAEFVAKPQAPLEIDGGAGPPSTQGRRGEGLGGNIGREPAGALLHHGEAAATASDRGADGDGAGIMAGGDLQARGAALGDAAHGADFGDDAAEHEGRSDLKRQAVALIAWSGFPSISIAPAPDLSL